MNEDRLYHLCVIQSPLISAVFEAGMRAAAIPEKWICSISRRSVEPIGNGVCLDQISNMLEKAFKSWDRLLYAKCKEDLFREIGFLTRDQPFIAYIPHTQLLMTQEIISHPWCIGYRFVEEGFTSMAWATHQGLRISKIKCFLSYLRALRTESNYRSGRDMFDLKNDRFRGALAITPAAFSGMEQVVNVSSCMKKPVDSDQPARLFVILDTCYLHRGILWQDYEEALSIAVVKEAGEYKEIIIKFHFVDTNSSSHYDSLLGKIRKNIRIPIRVVSRSYSVEKELNANDCVLFAVSSLGYYTAFFGGKVKCFADKIQGISLKAWIQKGALPKDFRVMAGLASNA